MPFYGIKRIYTSCFIRKSASQISGSLRAGLQIRSKYSKNTISLKFKGLINQIDMRLEALDMTFKLASQFSMDPDERAAFLTRHIAELNYNDDMQASKEIGEEIGIDKGIKITVTEMLKNGITDAEIKKYLHYSDDDIKTLRAEIAKGNTP
jgi:hypothetical protein